MEEITGEVLAELLSTSPQEKEELKATLENATGDERLNVLKEATKNLRSGFKKQGIDEATRKINSRWEKALSADGFDSSTQGVDRVSEFLEFVKSSTPQGGKVELTKEQILENPLVKDIVTKATQTWEEKYNTLSSKYQEEKQGRIESALRENLAKMAVATGTSLGDKPEMQETRISALVKLAKAEAHGFELDGDELYPLDKNGKPMLNDLLNKMTLKEFYTSKVNHNGNLFPISTVDNSKNNPQLSQSASSQKRGGNVRFSDQKDFMAQWSEAKTKDEKRALHQAWSEQQQAAKAN